MNIKGHFLIGLILSLILLPFFGTNSFIIIISSILLDIDHIFNYALNHNSINIKKAINHHKNLCGKHALSIFHTIEFIILLGILSSFSETILLLFIGAIAHLITDYYDWFIWFSLYSQRIPSIILYPLIKRRQKYYETKLKRIGHKCIVCGFDKAWDSHLIHGYKEVMLCPNHHFLVHRGLISDKELIKIIKNKINN